MKCFSMVFKYMMTSGRYRIFSCRFVEDLLTSYMLLERGKGVIQSEQCLYKRSQAILFNESFFRSCPSTKILQKLRHVLKVGRMRASCNDWIYYIILESKYESEVNTTLGYSVCQVSI